MPPQPSASTGHSIHPPATLQESGAPLEGRTVAQVSTESILAKALGQGSKMSLSGAIKDFSQSHCYGDKYRNAFLQILSILQARLIEWSAEDINALFEVKNDYAWITLAFLKIQGRVPGHTQDAMQAWEWVTDKDHHVSVSNQLLALRYIALTSDLMEPTCLRRMEGLLMTLAKERRNYKDYSCYYLALIFAYLRIYPGDVETEFTILFRYLNEADLKVLMASLVIDQHKWSPELVSIYIGTSGGSGADFASVCKGLLEDMSEGHPCLGPDQILFFLEQHSVNREALLYLLRFNPIRISPEILDKFQAIINEGSFPEQLRIFCNTELFLRNPKAT